MRILICSNAYPPHFVGGAELMAHEQAKALSCLGHDIRVFAGDPDSYGNRYERTDDVYEGIAVHRIATLPEDYSPEFLNFLHPRVDTHFREILHDFNPDIVHCHNLTGLSVKLPVIATQHGARSICTLHDFWGFCLRNTAIRWDGKTCDDISQCRSCLPRIHDGRKLHVPLRFRKDFIRLALDHVDRFIAPSRYIADRYIWAGLHSDRLAVLPNGMDIDRFRSPPQQPSDDIRITYAGYFGAHKGVATLVEAIALLPKNRNIMLQLAGEGPEKTAYLEQIAALGLEQHILFLGKVQPADMPSVYAHSDIVTLPSIWEENQPVCLMEAMAAGLPVTASRKGGIPELIEHGKNGLMFAANDAKDLAMQLTRLIDDPDLRRRIGREGQRKVEEFSHARQAIRQIEIYREVMRSPSSIGKSYDLFGATGNLRMKMTGEDKLLPDSEYPTRYFMPYDWIGDCISTFNGVILTGWLWRAARLLGISPIAAFPRRLRKIGRAILHRIGLATSLTP